MLLYVLVMYSVIFLVIAFGFLVMIISSVVFIGYSFFGYVLRLVSLVIASVVLPVMGAVVF